jgi:cation diffusion facilitator CzcD-associated flavoprotein CzcO
MEAKINGIENFQGKVIHPQFWPEDLDYAGKKLAVIGSGATAVTLIPALAKLAEKVTMVQRSPSYVISFPNRSRPKKWWEKMLPLSLQHKITRLRYLIGGFLYRRYLSGDSNKMREFLAKVTAAQLPKHIPFDPHFKPSYAPWTQRVCLCPDGDFFKALRDGNVDVATGVIDNVTDTSIVLKSGQTIEADIIITATGLQMKYGGNAEYYVDGEKVNFGDKFMWRGVMIEDMPNMTIVQGYTKASWTLGADATATMFIRFLKHLKRNNLSSGTPRIADKSKVQSLSASAGVMGLTSTYIKNAIHRLPRGSDQDPWKPRGSYLQDMFDAQFSNLKKGMQFTMAPYPS